MTSDKDFKRAVRSRMAKTGESYTTARARLRKRRDAEPAPSARYTFANLSAGAKQSLAAAEAIARAAGSVSIETRHVVTALPQRVPTTRLDREAAIQEALAAAESVIEEPEPGSSSESPRPSAQLRAALQHAFVAARERGETQVHEMHLLMGVLRVPESAGARALLALSANAAAVIESWPAGRRADWKVQRAAPDYAPELIELLARAQERARQGGLPEVRIEDVLAELPESG